MDTRMKKDDEFELLRDVRIKIWDLVSSRKGRVVKGRQLARVVYEEVEYVLECDEEEAKRIAEKLREIKGMLDVIYHRTEEGRSYLTVVYVGKTNFI